jgi:hypothetical protein
MPKSTEAHSSTPSNPNANSSSNESTKAPHRHLSKFIGLLKGHTKATVESKLAIDHVRAAAGSSKAQGHLGVLPKKQNLIYAGPAEFKARFHGEKGWLYIATSASTSSPTSTLPNTKSNSASAATEPCLLFITEDPRNQQNQIDASDKSKVLWEMAIRDIKRVKHATAFVSKTAEMASDWSEDTELLGSLEVDGEGQTWRFTAIPERDALFNRLVAVGGQRWENV